MMLCVRTIPEEDNPVPKYEAMILIMNCVVWFVLYCPLLSAFIGQYIEYLLKV